MEFEELDTNLIFIATHKRYCPSLVSCGPSLHLLLSILRPMLNPYSAVMTFFAQVHLGYKEGNISMIIHFLGKPNLMPKKGVVRHKFFVALLVQCMWDLVSLGLWKDMFGVWLLMRWDSPDALSGIKYCDGIHLVHN